MREGPSYDHKILWAYRHRGYPFLVTAGFDVWRRVVAADGTIARIWTKVKVKGHAEEVLAAAQLL